MNEVATNPNQTAVEAKPSETVPNGTQAPDGSMIRAALADARHKDEQAIANLTAEVIQLRKKVEGAKEELKKLPVSDEVFDKALAALQSDGKTDLATANPKASPNLSLSGILGVIPEMTKEQKAKWVPIRDGLRKQYSDVHRNLLGKRKAVLARVTRDPKALIATVHRERKDGTTARVSLSASQPAKAKKAKGPSKGKAKPAQIAGNVPVAGNAAKPAAV